MRNIWLLILYFMSSLALAETYGYVGFWHDPNNAQIIPEVKTTRENNDNFEDAYTEINQFCIAKDKLLNNGNRGCFFITPLQNTCAAVAWSRKRGLLSPDNIAVVVNPDFKKVGKLASKACRKQYGWFARCELETVYCTDTKKYQL